MKKIILILILSTSCYAQNGMITYGFINAMGMGNAKGPDSNSYMTFNKEMSYYVTAKDSLEKADNISEQKTFENDDHSGGVIHNGMKVSKEGDQVVYNIKKNTMWSNLFYRKQIYIKEPATQIKWTITKESKSIGKFKCKKATANFRGRTYVAWFTNEISVPYGPWKLNGLPGLILEAYDTNKNVYWYFKSIELPSKSKEKVKYMSIPKNQKFITYNEFKKVQMDEQNVVVEKGVMLKKLYPQIEVIKPELTEMFIECE